MPYRVASAGSCPEGKPFAVVNSDTGKVHGCHPTRKAAVRQLRALYVNVPDAQKATQPRRVHLSARTAPIHSGMADDVQARLRQLHDQLLASQAEGAQHDAAACALCTPPIPAKGAPVSKTYTEADLQAALGEALGPLRAELDQLRQSQEEAAVEERVQAAVEGATKPLADQVTQLQSDLEAAKIEAGNEKQRAEGLEAEKVETARRTEVAGRREARVARVKEVATFDDAFVDANAERWAEMEETAFEERVAEWAALSNKSGEEKVPTTTALMAATGDRGGQPTTTTPVTATGRPQRSPALRRLGEMHRGGVDVRKL